MKPVFFLLVIFLSATTVSGCRKTVDWEAENAQHQPVVPDGLEESSAEQWRCPENKSKLRFATRRELNAVNVRIAALKQKTWFGEVRTVSADALLIRADGKIAYRFDDANPTIPVLQIEEALVLDNSVGAPDPKKHRK